MRIFRERVTREGLRRELHLLLTTKPPTPREWAMGIVAGAVTMLAMILLLHWLVG
jgi:cell division septal protein FtsQ